MEKEFKEMNQKDFGDYVNSFDIAIEGNFHYEDYFWSYEEHLRLDSIKIENFNSTSDWSNWINNERELFLSYMGYDRYGDIEKEWIADPTIEPIIMIKQYNGFYDIVDGWHRTASAFKNNLETIPVILGTEKTI